MPPWISLTCMTTAEPTRRGRATRPAPREVYPTWPHGTAEGPDELVRAFVSNLAAFVESQAEAGASQAELCRQAGVTKSVLTKVLHGDVWPDSLTVAKFETLAGRRLWVGPKPAGA
ncbi:hypothetical protein [Corynebacterium diphtheriae]|uniref:hypothetical protein n=1 Tax=Corynebacterium diphtheriae TaxID=1717 RepID=UPI0015F4978C|nr:hypothetical protein [Corynebacterium diphtheriae]